MVISFFNKKGGVGKTPFAFSIAKDLGFYLQSNDESSIETIYPEMAKISEKPELIDDCVYDFGGFVDAGVLDILNGSDFIIVPCRADNNALSKTILTMKELEEEIKNFKRKIIVLATDWEKDEERETIKENILKHFENIKIFYFKRSTIVNRAIDYGKSFNEISQNVLLKYSYRHFLDEYFELLDIFKRNK